MRPYAYCVVRVFKNVVIDIIGIEDKGFGNGKTDAVGGTKRVKPDIGVIKSINFKLFAGLGKLSGLK